MNLEIVQATIDQKPILANLLELYAYDFTESQSFDIGDHGFYGYEYLPLYWTDLNRIPYLIYVEKKIAGFVLIQKGSPISNDQEVWDISEFFIMRKYKRQGIGTMVAFKIWQQFKGSWQVRVLTENKAACTFCLQAIEKFTQGIFTTTSMQIKEEHWIVYQFKSQG